MTAFVLRSANVTAAINVTPLVDVLLVLLIVFLAAAPAATQRLVLDNASCAVRCAAPSPPVRLAIKRTGELYWNGAAIDRAALARRLGALAVDQDAPELAIHVEPATRYAVLTDVLAAARNAGVTRIAVAPR